MAIENSNQTQRINRFIRLNPYQLWQRLREPDAAYQSFCRQHEYFAPIRFWGQDFLMTTSPEAIRAVFQSDPNNYDAF